VRSRFNLQLNLDDAWYTHQSYDLFSTNDIAVNTGVSIGYAVWMDGALSLVPELGFSGSNATGSKLFGGAVASTELDTWTYYGGASVRYALLSFLEPEARLAGGASVVQMSVSPSTGPSARTNEEVSPFVSVGGGFTLHTPARLFESRTGSLRTLLIGVTFEGGWLAGKSVDIAPTSDVAGARIPTTDAQLGKLDRSGPYFRASLAFRF
jgi:hypothetical protein